MEHIPGAALSVQLDRHEDVRESLVLECANPHSQCALEMSGAGIRACAPREPGVTAREPPALESRAPVQEELVHGVTRSFQFRNSAIRAQQKAIFEQLAHSLQTGGDFAVSEVSD